MAGAIKHMERSHMSCVHNYPVFVRKSYRGRWGYDKYIPRKITETVTKSSTPSASIRKPGLFRRFFAWLRSRLFRKKFGGIVR